MQSPSNSPSPRGGLAGYFVRRREVAWMALVAVLVWGAVAYTRLPQQEDPKIPDRAALLVTRFPGASPDRVEDLVTSKLEEKLGELDCIEELHSQSRAGVSVVTVKQFPRSRARVEQEWDKLRAKLREVALPEGCEAPFLDTDFGNTITVLLGLVSPPWSAGEVEARARPPRAALARLRAGRPAAGRAAVFALYPPGVDEAHQRDVLERFAADAQAQGVADDLRRDQGRGYILAEFAARTNRAGLEQFTRAFTRARLGSDTEVHPDFTGPVILWEGEDPAPALARLAMPRHSFRELEVLADRLKDDLKQLESVGKVQKIGAVQELVYLLFSVATVNGYNLASEEVLAAIAARNAVIPGGTFSSEGQNFPVRLSGEFADEQQMLGTIVGLARETGLPIYLRDLFEVRRGYPDPVPFRVDVLAREGAGGALTPHRAVLLAVEMKEGHVIGDFGAAVDRVVAGLRPLLPEGVQVVKLSDQPQAVVQRIAKFIQCFGEAVLVVVLVALFLMEWRSALVVAAAIPLTVALTLGGMAICQVPLHQISISSLILALGMLVDDPVVASDAINRELAHGQPRGLAAWLGPFKLRRAILFATLINILAFLPLALLPGDKGAFILALPMVVTLALVSSRLVSMTFVPLLGYYLLRGQKGFEAGGETRSFPAFKLVDTALQKGLPRYRHWLEAALARPGRAIAIAYGALALSFALTPFFGAQFFPPAERNQMLVDIQLPESASIMQTREVCREVVASLQDRPEIVSAAVFIGGTAPRFYYNVVPGEPGSYLAQVLINTRRDRDVPPLLAELRARLDRNVAGARCVVKQLEQGPPVETPIQIRLTGPDLDALRQRADQVAVALRQAGAYKVHDDLGHRIPALLIAIDQERANTLAIDNRRIGQLAQAAFTGLRVTELREGDHLVPVLARLRVEERNEADKIRTLYVKSPTGGLVPVESFATLSNRMEYATIAHHNKLRAVTVKAYSTVGELPSTVLARARGAIEKLSATTPAPRTTAELAGTPSPAPKGILSPTGGEGRARGRPSIPQASIPPPDEFGVLSLPAGCRIEFVGEDKELRESRAEMGLVMAVSLGLIALAMVIQFQSVMKSLVVMLTVPLGLIGAFTGLAVMGASFGFMALLGIVSLAGVIVSHIIVLSDFIEEARAEGMALKEALVQAGLVRLRAVLVTALATVGGLIPLALTGGELWRPLTAVHIFGLLFATALTLVLLPVLYYVFCARLRWLR